MDACVATRGRGRLRACRVVAIALLFAFAPPSRAAGGASDSFRPDDIFDIEFALDPQIAPDGASIVYTRQYSDRITDARYSNLWIVGADGSAHRPLTGGKQRDRGARWSPDGRQLAYVSDRDGLPQLYVLSLDSGRSTRLTALPRPVARLAWSPDGRTIAFLSEVPSEPVRLAHLPEPSAGAHARPRAQIYTRLNYRREQLGFSSGYTHVFVVPATGGAVRRISEGDFDHGSVGAAEWEDAAGIAWTRDGATVIVSSNRRADAELEPFDTELYAVGLHGEGTRVLTNRRGPDTSPVVSPDGSRLAYAGFDDHRRQYTVRRLYVANPDGTGSRALTATLDSSVRGVQWAPDGRGLYFLFDRQGRTLLAHQSLDGSLREIAGNVGTGYMNYGFGAGFSVARNGRIAFTQEGVHTVGALAVWEPQTRRVRTILNLNEHWLSRRTLAPVEELWVTSPVDGRRIHGWILKPPNFDPGKKYPLVLEIHGGPTTNIGGDRFDIEKQLYAAHGYVVLFMNPRGSTSYGEEFTSLIHLKYPGDEYFDLSAGIDALVARGYIDERNLFVTGGSGGGVLTCWMVGRSQRFTAAVAQYGYVNAVSQTLSSDIPWIANYWFRGPPWEYPQDYWDRSPLSLVGNVTTPTMMMVGLDEVRAPPWESEQYFKALKMRGIDTALVHFPDEPHGIRIYPSHHVEKVLTIIGWFERYRRS